MQFKTNMYLLMFSTNCFISTPARRSQNQNMTLMAASRIDILSYQHSNGNENRCEWHIKTKTLVSVQIKKNI